MQARHFWRARWLVSAVSSALLASALVGTEQAAAAQAPELPATASVPGVAAKALPKPADRAVAAAIGMIPAPDWAKGSWTAASNTARARVETLDRAAAVKAGVSGQIVRLSRTDRAQGTATMTLTTDYSSYRRAFGGDYAARLHVVRLPECALSTPERAHCRPMPVPSRNDTKTGKITADVAVQPTVSERSGVLAGTEPQLAAASTLFAVTAAPNGSAGDFKATSLSPSATWSVGLQSGDFNWSYPIDTPDMPGGSPQVGLSYTSGTTDGRTAGTNNQVSWIGEGFDYQPGYIERRYQPCTEDGQLGKEDMCWASHNAVLNLNGAVELVRDDATGVWRSETDDSYKVELRTGAVNGDDNGEHWVVTARDGTQYHYGSRPSAKSTWTVPVFGDDAGEPCNSTGGFESSWCQQAYRWSLDYVIDRHGDVISYFYDVDVNNYGRSGSSGAVTPYVRSGQIARIEYGLRTDQAGAAATARVKFVAAERCLDGSACSQPQDFPDTPLDLRCDGPVCAVNSPVFFSTKRLSKIVTQVLVGGTYQDVESWTFNHLFPATGDSTSPSLWLESIVHTGHAGGTVTMPEVNFDGVQGRNRVADGSWEPMLKWRVSNIANETGGQTQITYASQQCAVSAEHANDQRCFPAYWSPAGQTNPILEYFHKYVVASVKEVDAVGGNPAEETHYEYVGGPAWHYDDAELVAENRKTYGQLRGFQTVRVRTGSGIDGPQTLTEHLFLRGMHDDRLPGGTRRNVSVTDSRGGIITDSSQLRGFARETRVFNGVAGAWVSTTINEPWVLGPTARRLRSAGPLEAYKTELRVVKKWTARSDGAVDLTELQSTYDNFGRVAQVHDLGDVSTADDDTCVRHWYNENQALWILDTVKRIEKVSVGCNVAATDTHVLSEERMYYDGATGQDTPPVIGNVTKAEELKEISAGVRSYASAGNSTYDVHGRVVEDYDPSGDKTTTSYTPSAGGPVVSVSVTNPLGFVTTDTFDPITGEKQSQVDPNGRKTEFGHDAMGRVTGVWLPGRAKTTQTANVTYGYLIRSNGPSAVTTRTLQGNGAYTATYTLFDGFLQERQVQAPSPIGGRVVTDTFHDSHGRIVRTNNQYRNNSTPGTTLLAGVANSDLNGYTTWTFDGAGRETDEIFHVAGAERWRTKSSYGGNWTAEQPPAGGTATMKMLDANGKTIELRQFHSGAPTGSYDSTKYTYDKAGRLSAVVDAAGNTWRYSHDLRGRQIRTEDPDKGVVTSSYDDEDQVIASTDSRGRTLSFAYDVLGRRTGVSEGSTQLAAWEFDTLPGGRELQTAAVSFVNGHAYRQETIGYDASTGRPTGSAVVIPEAEGALAGRYESTVSYNLAGQIVSTTLPAVGGLPAETLSNSFNALGLPAELKSNLTTYSTLSYDDLASINQIRRGVSGKYVYQTFSLDAGSRLLNRAVTSRQGVTPAIAADVHYSYDPAGNVTRMADKPNGGTQDIQCIKLDYLRRMTEAWTPATDNCAAAPAVSGLGGPAPYWHSYTYDKTGNRLSEVQHSASGDTTRTYSHPSPGSAQPHTVRSVSTTGPGMSNVDTFAYDSDGNTTSRKVNGVEQNLSWDAEGHLSNVSAGGGNTSFAYNAGGERLIRRDPSGTTLYLGSTELRLEGTVIKGTRYYEHGGQTIAVRTGSELTWLGSDHHGTSELAIDATSLEVTQRRHLPFGALRTAEPANWPGERGFVGGTKDASTGLTHLGAREYDPLIGRFISVDPIIDVFDPQQMHGFLYSNNSPFTYSDPDGLLWDWLEKARKNPLWTWGKNLLTIAAPICTICGGVALGMSAIDALGEWQAGNKAGAVAEILTGVVPGAGSFIAKGVAKGLGAAAKNAKNLAKVADRRANTLDRWGDYAGNIAKGGKAVNRPFVPKSIRNAGKKVETAATKAKNALAKAAAAKRAARDRLLAKDAALDRAAGISNKVSKGADYVGAGFAVNSLATGDSPPKKKPKPKPVKIKSKNSTRCKGKVCMSAL